MARIETNVPHLKVSLGVWRKLNALMGGHLDGINNVDRDDLWDVGLSPDFWVAIDAMKSWKVPFYVVMILWALRERQLEDGGFLRLGELSGYAETGTVYRYAELALLAGEGPEEDVHIKRAVRWLLNHQLQDGSFPTHETSSVGEVGTTARTIRVLAMVLERGRGEEGVMNAVQKAMRYIRKEHCRQGNLGWWHRTKRDEKRGVVGASSLAVLAILKVKALSKDFRIEIPVETIPVETVEPTLRWLVEEFEGMGWPESKGGHPKIDTTFYTSWALLWAMEEGFHVDDEGSVHRKILRALEELHDLTRRTLYDTSFALRFLALVTRYRKVLRVRKELLRALIKKYLRRLKGEIGRVMKSDSDAYLMELVGITLLEVNAAMEELKMEKEMSELRKFPGMPPSFMLREILERSSNASDVLYVLIGPRTRWRPFIALVDALVKMDILTTLIGITLGLLVIMNDFSEVLFRALISPGSAYVGTASLLVVILLTAGWVGLKLLPEKSRLEGIISYALAVLAAYMYITTFLVTSGIGIPNTMAFLKVLLLLAIVIDVTVKLLDTAVFSKILGG